MLKIRPKRILNIKPCGSGYICTMKKVKGEIILIDTQKYEKELLNVSLDRLKYEIHIKYLTSAQDLINYLKTSEEDVFLIISDFHLKHVNEGIELIKFINKDPKLKKKSIPFIFTSDNSTKEEVEEAYKCHVQGFFKKPQSMDRMSEILEIIIKYWIVNKHPNESIHSGDDTLISLV